ncbi:MAG: maltose alpha-D-glucosyltransferase, partial [Elusimicrobia bacterium]|nr:maltose alpha-D-glucosyltransferase [Elusimicrobiota bacterium]
MTLPPAYRLEGDLPRRNSWNSMDQSPRNLLDSRGKIQKSRHAGQAGGRVSPSKTKLKNDPLWYKDAIIYELNVKSFSDSNGDGTGDFRGLINKIPYLQNLGITAIWLLPFYPSPLKDDGYDISDYYKINPEYGSMTDFKELLKVAHAHGIRVITELVINHTSDQHPWFQRARLAKPGSVWRNFYVWNDTPDKYSDARIIFNDFESSNWTWDPAAKAHYWHRFYSHQPDLNYENAAVQKEIVKVMDFWFGMGVDGMRIDAVPYLYEEEGTNCENLPKTHAFLKKLRAHVDLKHKNKMFLCEANQWPEDVAEYFGKGDECQMAFHFPLMPRLFMSLWMEESFPIADILDQTPAIPDNCQWAIFLRNHDELTLEMVTDEERDYMYKVYARDMKARINMGIRRRLAPLLGNSRRKIELMNMLLFSLPGTSVMYYGDELGMGDNYYLGDRNGVRTPMQWSPDRNAGFSCANPHKLFLPIIIDPEYHYESVNVENQESNVSSMLWWTKRIISLRKRFKAFSRGSFEIVQSDNSKILSFIRKYGDEIILVAVNLSRFSQVVNLNLSEYAGYTPIEMFSGNEFPQIKEQPYILTPSLHHCYWFQLKKEEKKEEALEGKISEIKINSASYSALLEEENIPFFEKILQSYVKKCRWFGGKGRKLRELKISHIMRVSYKEDCAKILFMDISYSDGHFETYVLPIAYVEEKDSVSVLAENPNSAILAIELSGKKGLIIDAVYDAQFRTDFIKLFGSRKKMKSDVEISPKRGRKFAKSLAKNISISESKVLKAEQSNTSIIYGN